MLDDYRDIDFGWLDDVIELASFNYYAYVKYDANINLDGTTQNIYKRHIVRGSLQTYRKRRNYSNDGETPNVSSREGKFYTRYDVVLNEGDIIQKNSDFFKIKNPSDFDYAGVRNYEVERMEIDEIENFDFEKYIDDTFETEE